ncbi:MAG TPA: hypothetical protein VFH72_13255 [Candidatus Baltobacteraceae bacterium]|nr:hypothetical protein [Candidatus Baltobacteraceae bacterium]
MRTSTTRYLAAFAACIAGAALAACGAGGSSTALTPPTAVATPVPAPPTPTPSPYPSTDGETFTYHGSYTQQYTIYGTPAPSPAAGTPEPTATPWTASDTEDVSQTVTLHQNASYNGVTGLTQLDGKETDTGARSTYTVDTQQYVQLTADATRINGENLTQIALDATDSNGVESTTTFENGNGVLDELPQVPASQWSNSAARIEIENDPSGESISNTFAGDGSYTASTLFPQGGTATITENSDGSGMYVLPFLGVSGSEVTIAAPVNDAIAITFKQLATGVVGWGSVPVWYPALPAVLASDSFVDAGVNPIPSSCNVPSSIGTRATRIDEQRARLDAIFGELERSEQSSYVVPPYGAVCIVMHDDLQVYYDYSGQTAYIFSGTPLRETVSDETLGITDVPSTSAKARAQSRHGASAAVAAPFVAPSTARLALGIAKRHLQFVRRTGSAAKEAR